MKEKEILLALQDHFKESLFVTDGEGTVIYANRVAAERLDLDLETLIGKNVRQLVEAGVYTKSTTLEAIHTKNSVIGPINEGQKSTFSNSVPVLNESNEVIMVVTSNMSIKHNAEWEKIIRDTQQERDKLRRRLDFMHLREQRVVIAESQVMKNILKTLETIAPTDSNVVLLGESGTGKDMMAKLLHERSERATNPYICINCAAMPENLLESELFGYEGGAFTGALAKGKIGLFEAASGGTLFLDEIGDMSLALQTKLLRVIENREVRRIGGIESIPVDVRIVCATNANLFRLVEEKKFREDLYYRLNVFTITLPRLRDRQEDIVPIADLFLEELNRKYDTNKVFSDITIKTMLEYDWPGNIRELRNVVERVFVISHGDELVFRPMPSFTAEYAQYNESNSEFFLEHSFESLRDFVEHAEGLYIKKILDECEGSIGKTAKRLGIHRSALYRKLHKK